MGWKCRQAQSSLDVICQVQVTSWLKEDILKATRPPNKKGPIPEKSYYEIGEDSPRLHSVGHTNLGLEGEQSQTNEYTKRDETRAPNEYWIQVSRNIHILTAPASQWCYQKTQPPHQGWMPPSMWRSTTRRSSKDGCGASSKVRRDWSKFQREERRRPRRWEKVKVAAIAPVDNVLCLDPEYRRRWLRYSATNDASGQLS